MQPTIPNKPTSQTGPITPMSSNLDSSRAEDSELKALASSAKKRRTKRMSSQIDAQDSMLQTTASLSSVALPVPSKVRPVAIDNGGLGVGIEAIPTPAAVAKSSSLAMKSVSAPAVSAQEVVSSSSSSNRWPWIAGLGLAGIVAAGAFFMLGNNSDSKSNVVAAAAVETSDIKKPMAMVEGIETATIHSDSPVPSPDKVEAALAVTPDERVQAIADKTERAPEKAPAEKAIEAKDIELKNKEAKQGLADKKQKKTEPLSADKQAAKLEKKAALKAEKDAAKKANQKTPKLKEGASLDDVLTSVTGGIDTPMVNKEEDKGPSKTKLTSSDVSKAMKSVRGSAKACYSVEEFSGNVIVKYSVGQNGKITKANAMGAHKSSKTGKCVVRAVKKAHFPAFSGSTQSFSFPFLLSP